MKLEKILDNLGSLEKNSFIKIIDNIISDKPKHTKEIEIILSDSDKGLKNVDSQNIVKIFNLVETEFAEIIKAEFVDTSTQLDILIDIIIRDGNCIIKLDWFSRLYENELKQLQKKIKSLETDLNNEKSEISEQRKRDYTIYRSCLYTAYMNDLKHNRDAKITDEELSILLTLAKELELSQDDVKLINYMIIPFEKSDIDSVINSLKNIGVVFYSKKFNIVYVADEMVRLLRKVREKQIADKFFRRILRLLREPQINLICRKHNIDWKRPLNEKIKEIINRGISFTNVLINEIHKDGTSLTERKKAIIDLCDKGLNIKPVLKGTTLGDKIANLILFFDEIEKDEKVGISIDGYEKMLTELEENKLNLNKHVKEEFELQEEKVLSSKYLLDYNIKPRDILDLMPIKDLNSFCKVRGISTRGDEVLNILDHYKDVENLYLENYENIGFRDLNALKENGIGLKEAELGLKFEELTKTIFNLLGFNVDESLKKKLNTRKDKIDILINLEENIELIIVECKTVKNNKYNKFSSVSRQLKAYYDLVSANNYRVIKILLVAPEFSDEFINDCELDTELNLSLLTASSLLKILEGFKKSQKHKQFPYKLLMRDVLINEDRILKAINK
jgi:hypothetical protein